MSFRLPKRVPYLILCALFLFVAGGAHAAPKAEAKPGKLIGDFLSFLKTTKEAKETEKGKFASDSADFARLEKEIKDLDSRMRELERGLEETKSAKDRTAEEAAWKALIAIADRNFQQSLKNGEIQGKLKERVSTYEFQKIRDEVGNWGTGKNPQAVNGVRVALMKLWINEGVSLGELAPAEKTKLLEILFEALQEKSPQKTQDKFYELLVKEQQKSGVSESEAKKRADEWKEKCNFWKGLAAAL